MQSWDARFVAECKARIIEDIEQRYANFGQGGWIIRDDVAATGMAAILIQAQIAGLKLAIKHIEQTHDAMTGKVPDRKQKDAA